MLPAGSAGPGPCDGTVAGGESLIVNDSAAGSQSSGAGWVNPEDHCQPVNSSGDGSVESSASQSVLADIVDLAQDSQSGEVAHYNSSSLSTPGDLPLGLDSDQLVSIQDADAIAGVDTPVEYPVQFQGLFFTAGESIAAAQDHTVFEAPVGAAADGSTEQISGIVSTGLEIGYSALNQNDALAPTSAGSPDSLGFFQDPNGGLTTFADATGSDSITVTNIVNVDASDTAPTPLIYIGGNAWEVISATVEATNIYSAAGATVGMNNTVGDGASLTVGNYADNAATPVGLTNFLDIVYGGAVPTDIESTNWSGAVITAASGESFSTVSAQWVVPTVAQVPITGVTNSDVAEWVGIDGYQSADVCQAGVLEIVQTSAHGQTTITCEAFVEWYPAAADIIPASSFQVSPGNTIQVTVETTGAGATTATFVLDDETTGKTYDISLTAPTGTHLQGNSAEFVVETPEVNGGQPLLSDFLNSPVVFQGVSAIYVGGSAASLSSAQSIGMWTNDVPGSNGSSVQEAYGSVQSGSVTVTEDDYWPAAAPPVTAAPTVTSVVESPNSGIANVGTKVAITIELNETVTVAGGTPTLALNDGGTASYSGGSGTDALTFDYTVQSGQNTKNLLISFINLDGATIADASGNNADFSDLTSFTPGNLEIYTTPTASVSAHSFTVSLQAVAASSFFTITNPSGDSITQYSFEDNGGGSGHFTVAGTVEPDGQTFTVSANNLSSVQYVGGGSAGTDTLTIDAYDATAAAWVPSVSISAVTTAPFLTIQNDYLAITRTALPVDQATAIANAIDAGTQTEAQYVNGLLSQVADTTIPAVAVEASMYGVTGTSAEITSLVTNYLPAQVQNAIVNGYNPQIYACEALGLVFAFGNENGSTAFANNYGPSNAAMPNTTAGDASFAAAAASLIFGSAETSNTVPAIEQWVSNWKAFYTADGIAGVSSNPTAQQIDLAARGAAWGDAIGLALFDNLGPFPGQITNFLEDAAQGTAVYGAPLSTQPTPAAFQGAASGSGGGAASDVQLIGVTTHNDFSG